MTNDLDVKRNITELRRVLEMREIFSIVKLLAGTGAIPVRSVHQTVSGICSDSRYAHEGVLFLCICGIHHDGHDFAAEAVRRGASVVLAERSDLVLPDDCDLWVCPNTRLAEAIVWNNRYDCPANGMTAVAITGSNGKTSTAYMLRTIFSGAGEKTGAITTLGAFSGEESISLGENGGTALADTASAMTTPDAEWFYGALAAMRERGCTYLVYEASSHALALHKTDAVSPHIAVFTGLDHEHLDYHGTMEKYFSAKSRLFDMLSNRSNGVGICNADDPYSARLMQEHPNISFRACTTNAAHAEKYDVTVLHLEEQSQGSAFLYSSRDVLLRIHLPIPGRYTIANAMYAATAALSLGIYPIEIRESLASMPPIPGRMERVQLPGVPFSAYIDYAHTPRAVEAVLQTLRSLHPVRLSVLFGCGGDRDQEKRPLMGKIASMLADRVIVTDDNPRCEHPKKIAEAIVSGIIPGTAYTVIQDRSEAISHMVQTAVPGEILAFLGKGHERYMWIQNEKLPFDEKEKIIDAAARWHGKKTTSV